MRLLFILLLCLTPYGFSALPEGYQLKTISLPDGGSASVLGICQKDDETMAVCTWEGEVWEYKNEKWTKFAEGLMDPNGIYWDKKENAYYVAQKPELTRLIDLDNDGIADRYENYTDRFGYTKDYHEYHFGPIVDSLGRKYATLNLSQSGLPTKGKHRDGPGWSYMRYSGDYRGWIYRSDRHGHFHPIATGFRSPAGLGISPKDELFVTDNQGDWMPACGLFFIREGGFYGHPTGLAGHPAFGKDALEKLTPDDLVGIREMPAIWFPRGEISNSPGSPVWDTTQGKFGPFQGQIFIGDQTLSNFFRCDIEWVANQYQGFCVPFMSQTQSGTVKLAFDPKGRLWSAQVGRGWNSRGGKRSAIQYLEWDGNTIPMEIYKVSLNDKGFHITFTHPVTSEAIKASLPKITSWHYHHWSKYGSPRLDLKSLPLKNWVLSEDGKSLTIETELIRNNVYKIEFPNLISNNNKKLVNNIAYYTLNKLKGDSPKVTANCGYDNTPFLKGSSWKIHDKTRILPTVVSPLSWDKTVLPLPKNAIKLDSSKWDNPNWKENEEGAIYRSKGNWKTKEQFGDARFHIEFRFDESENVKTQLYGNSGIFFMEHYEMQVLNAYENPVYADGQCGALYGQQPPLVNAARKPGQWQSYDVIMKAPRFDDKGQLLEPLRLTVYHNGILIHDDASFIGRTYHRVNPPYQKHGKLPLMIQDHAGSPVAFRNIWVVPDIDYDRELESFRLLFSSK